MTDYRRYAIYYTPDPGSDLARLGTHWLGWDMDAGAPAPQINIEGLPEPIEDLTEAPRRYGFHATLKAPFFLHPDHTPLELHHAVMELAGRTNSIRLPGLTMSNQSGFLALRPVGDTSALDAMAASVVRDLDPFRAPMSEAERARRDTGRLSPEQRENLDNWGYPYVFDDFRFHITLTGARGNGAVQALRSQLAPILEPNLPRPFEIGALTLCGEASDAMFRVIQRYPLADQQGRLSAVPRTEAGEQILLAPKFP